LEPVKTAIFADERYTFLIARIYESLMEDAVAITVRAFRKRELAADWLGVPLAILRPPAKPARSLTADAPADGARVSLLIISYSLFVREVSSIDGSNRRSHLPGYAAWEIHPAMKIEVQ
jgi:hypothetical protein